jgi:hypothetical protein
MPLTCGDACTIAMVSRLGMVTVLTVPIQDQRHPTAFGAVHAAPLRLRVSEQRSQCPRSIDAGASISWPHTVQEGPVQGSVVSPVAAVTDVTESGGPRGSR